MQTGFEMPGRIARAHTSLFIADRGESSRIKSIFDKASSREEMLRAHHLMSAAGIRLDRRAKGADCSAQV
jgi:hypothetical protein